MIQMHLSSVQIWWMPFIRILVITILDDMIADIMTNKKFQAMVKELFIRCRKLNISVLFITQSYFSVLKDVRLNTTHYFIMKITNKRELQNIDVIILQMLITKILWKFTENAQKNLFIFGQLMLHYKNLFEYL